MTTLRGKKILWFLGLTFAVSWLIAGLYFGRGGTVASLAAVPVFLLYMFVPMAMALLVQRGIYKEPVLRPLGIATRPHWGWMLAAWLLPPLLALAAFAVALLLPDVSYAPGMEGFLARFEGRLTPEQLAEMQRQLASTPPIVILLVALGGGLLAGLTVNAVAGFGEELGWRGLLQRELAPLGFWRSSLLIGLIWGLWHAPIIWHGYNYPDHPRLGVLMMTVFTLLFAPLIGYVRLRARSVFAAAVMHGALNGTVGLAVMFLRGGSDLTVGLLGLAGFSVLVVCNLLLWLYERHLAKEPVMAAYAQQEP